MSVNITGGGLDFEATIDEDGKFKAQAGQLEKSILQLKVRAETLGNSIENSLDPEFIKKYNRVIQDTQAEIKRLQNVGKEGFDELGNKIKTNTGLLGAFNNALGKIAIYLGTLFAVNKIIAFGASIVDVTQKVEGIERAFDRINSPNLLDNLRKATRGTVSDLELMQRAVLANQFNFPVDKLAAFFEFATKRARDLGVDSAKFVNDIIAGTARGSVRILDNLGISQQEIRNEVKKTGDFTTAVYNVIQRDLQKTGKEADTTADKMGRISSTITDIEGNIGKSSTGIISKITDLVQWQLNLINDFVIGLDGRLEALGKKFAVQDNSKLLQSFKDDTPEGRASAIKGYETLIAKQTQAVANYDAKISDVQNDLNLLQRIGRAAFTSLNDDLENKRNTQVVLLNEYKGELSSLKGIQDEEDRQKKARQLLDDQNASKVAEALNRKRSLLEQINQVEQGYNRNSLTADQAEVQAVNDKFKDLANRIKAFNADPTNKKFNVRIDGSALEPARKSAVDTVLAQQDVQKQELSIEKQKQIYKQYEDFKLKAGTDAADKLYANEIGKYKSYIDYLKSLEPDADDKSAKANATRDLLKKLNEQADKEDIQRNFDYLNKLVLQTTTYAQKRAEIIASSNKDIATLTELGLNQQAAQLAQNTQDQLTQLDVKAFETQGKYKDLFDNIDRLSTAFAKKQINQAYGSAAIDLAVGIATNGKSGITQKAYDQIIENLNKLDQAIKDRLPNDIQSVSSVLITLGNSISSINSGLGVLLTGLGSIGGNVSNVIKLKNAFDDAKAGQEKFQAGVNLIAAGLNGLTSLVDVFTSSAKQRKDAETAYYDAVLSSQNDYNLSLIQQLRLQEELSKNVFITDYKTDILNASKALAAANDEYAKSLVKLNNEGQAKVGQRNVVDPKSLMGGAASGATAGAAIGGLIGTAIPIPIIGSVAGAVGGAIIGGLVGLIGGLFGGKKKVDTFGPILQQFPELIKSTGEFSDELAQSLITNNLVDDKTKILLQNTIKLNDERAAAVAQINQDISNLAGSLGDDLRNSLVQAFEDGTDAAQAFGNSVSKVIESIVAQFLFNDIFGSQFTDLEAKMKESLGVTGDGSVVDDLTQFFKDAGPLVKQYQDALKAAQEAGAANGLTLFAPSNSSANNSPGLTGQVKAITEDTAGLLVGQFNGQRVATLQMLDEIIKNNAVNRQLFEQAVQNFNVQIKIEANTFRTANNTDQIVPTLERIETKMNANANALAANGR